MKMPSQIKAEDNFDYDKSISTLHIEKEPAVDFSEYMWMENVDEFDEQVMKQLEEEELMEECIEAMLEEEDELDGVKPPEKLDDIVYEFTKIISAKGKMEPAKKICLNPNADEFIPRVRTQLYEA